MSTAASPKTRAQARRVRGVQDLCPEVPAQEGAESQQEGTKKERTTRESAQGRDVGEACRLQVPVRFVPGGLGGSHSAGRKHQAIPPALRSGESLSHAPGAPGTPLRLYSVP